METEEGLESLEELERELNGKTGDEVEEMAEEYDDLDRENIEELRNHGERITPFISDEVRLAEDGLSRNDIESTVPEREVEDLLIEDENIGYNPDEEDFDIYGNLTITEADQVMHVRYVLTDLSNGKNGSPLFMEFPEEFTEKALRSFIETEDISAEVEKVEGEGYLDISFTYGKDDIQTNTEYLAEAISDFEEDVNLENYSGR